VAGDMVGRGFDHMRLDANVGHPSCGRTADIMQPPISISRALSGAPTTATRVARIRLSSAAFDPE
jgi:hypothetical protein